jgi:hypothetical protein
MIKIEVRVRVLRRNKIKTRNKIALAGVIQMIPISNFSFRMTMKYKTKDPAAKKTNNEITINNPTKTVTICNSKKKAKNKQMKTKTNKKTIN